MISVKIGKLPGKISEFGLEDGCTVGEALAIAELDAEGLEIRVNSALADEETELSNNDTVLLVKKIKGN